MSFYLAERSVSLQDVGLHFTALELQRERIR